MTHLPLTLHALRWLYAVPDFPGRDTLGDFLAARARRLDAEVEDTFGAGLRFRGNPAEDDNAVAFFMLRFAAPALAPVLEAALTEGGGFADVGANLGVYSLWAAKLVGSRGEVHAFEPADRTFYGLQRNVELNAFRQVQLNQCAVGAEEGTLTLYRHSRASGLTSRYLVGTEHPFQVPVVTLDTYYRERRPPQLVKIDVEAMESEVIRGARELLSGPNPPIVVWESELKSLEKAGVSYGEIAAFLADVAGLETWALTTSGLQPQESSTAQPGSMNSLSARRGLEAHDSVLDRLAKVRFQENQNV